MPTPAEHKALLFLASVIALGAGVRVVRARADAPADPLAARALAAQIARVDSARTWSGRERSGGVRARKKQKPAPSALPQTPIDVDRAVAAELDRLPGIGTVVAARIIADRDSFGDFGSLEGLQRVRGIGPRLAERLRPHVTFSGIARPASAVPGRRTRSARERVVGRGHFP